MKNTYKYGGIVAAFVLVAILAMAGVARANPSVFSRTAQTTTATSTATTVYTVAATSTSVVYDSYNLANTSTLFTKSTDAVLLIQVGATSTTPVVYYTAEYAQEPISGQDCAVTQTACDWYADQISAPLAGAVTSLNFPKLFTVTGLNGTTTKAAYLPTPTRYVRIRVWTTGAQANVWMQIVPNKESIK